MPFSSKLKASKMRRMSEIEQEMETLEGQQKVQFTEQISNIISTLRGEYNSLSLHKAELIMHRTRLKYYFQGDRPC